jgi:hypothetical protein
MQTKPSQEECVSVPTHMHLYIADMHMGGFQVVL